MADDRITVDHHSTEHFKSLQLIQQQVRHRFDVYKRVSDADSVPNFQELYMRYRDKVDIYSFFKPIVHGYRALIATEGRNNPELLAYYMETSYGILRRMITTDTPLYVFAWFEFHIAHLRAFHNGLQDLTKLYEWLRICYDTQDKDAVHFFVFFQLSRNEEMRQVVFDNNGQVRDFFHLPHMPGYAYLDKLATWFVARYDLDAAFMVHDIFATGQPQHTQIRPIGTAAMKRLFQRPAFWLILISTALLLLGKWGSLSSTLLCWVYPLDPSKGRTYVFLPYQGVSLLLFLLGLYYLYFYGWYNQLFRILPRLVGGILVGYIPLISSEDLWKWLLNLPTASAPWLWLLALAFSYVYLYIEACTKLISDCAVSPDLRRDVRIRSGQVCLIGLAEAYVIGVVLCEIWGGPAVNGLLKTADAAMPHVYAIKGWLGVLVPKVIVLYAPLALSLGILVQLLWEEKTVTQPL
jgi:hypothetical protein